MSLVPLQSPSKYQKISGFLIIKDKEKEQWHEVS